MSSKRMKERESKTTIQSSADSKLREINKRCSLLKLLFKYCFNYEETLDIFRGFFYFFRKTERLKKNIVQQLIDIRTACF